MQNIEPDYYKGKKADVIDFAHDHNLDFLQGNIVKYVTRYKGKNGLEDLIKARTYLDRLIQYESEKE